MTTSLSSCYRRLMLKTSDFYVDLHLKIWLIIAIYDKVTMHYNIDTEPLILAQSTVMRNKYTKKFEWSKLRRSKNKAFYFKSAAGKADCLEKIPDYYTARHQVRQSNYSDKSFATNNNNLYRDIVYERCLI